MQRGANLLRAALTAGKLALLQSGCGQRKAALVVRRTALKVGLSEPSKFQPEPTWLRWFATLPLHKRNSAAAFGL